MTIAMCLQKVGKKDQAKLKIHLSSQCFFPSWCRRRWQDFSVCMPHSFAGLSRARPFRFCKTSSAPLVAETGRPSAFPHTNLGRPLEVERMPM